MRHAIERQLAADWSRLYGYALALTRDRDAAADLVQQAAVRALGTAHTPQDQHTVRAWLFRLVRNGWIDAHRHQVVRAAHVAEPLAEPSGPWLHDDRLIDDMSVRQGLALLDPHHREIVELVDIAGFSYGEAADILAVPVGTVTSRLARARLALIEIVSGGVCSLDGARTRRRTR